MPQRTATLFPGEGSLTADAGETALAQWPELVDQAAERLDEDPFAAAAQTTAWAQPAILVAAWRAGQRSLDGVCAIAGHSLGELTALTLAEALTREDGLRLVVLRGRVMAQAAEAHPGETVLALLGSDPERAIALAARHSVFVANDNAPAQVVLSGNARLLRAAAVDARRQGLKTLELDVTGAFCSPVMRPGVLPLRRAFEQTTVRAPRVPVVSGLTARPFTDLPAKLSQAVIAPVRWCETMAAPVAGGEADFVDVGPGRVLELLVERNVKESDAVAA